MKEIDALGIGGGGTCRYIRFICVVEEFKEFAKDKRNTSSSVYPVAESAPEVAHAVGGVHGGKPVQITLNKLLLFQNETRIEICSSHRTFTPS